MYYIKSVTYTKPFCMYYYIYFRTHIHYIYSHRYFKPGFHPSVFIYRMPNGIRHGHTISAQRNKSKASKRYTRLYYIYVLCVPHMRACINGLKDCVLLYTFTCGNRKCLSRSIIRVSSHVCYVLRVADFCSGHIMFCHQFDLSSFYYLSCN